MPSLSRSLPALTTASLVMLAGCAAVPEASTSASAPAECKVAPLQTASLSGGKRRPVDRLDQVKAEADFNRYLANNPHLSPSRQLMLEEIQRDCSR